MIGDWREKPDRILINKKPLELNEKMWEKNQKIVLL